MKAYSCQFVLQIELRYLIIIIRAIFLSIQSQIGHVILLFLYKFFFI